MSTPSGESGSFWSTVPGTITALATLVTTLAGAYVAINPPGGDIEEACKIKGNISQKSGDKIYHLPDDKDYDNTEINPEKGEKWFCSESEAVKNGWRRAPR